jgi:hypothetical protein
LEALDEEGEEGIEDNSDDGEVVINPKALGFSDDNKKWLKIKRKVC